MVISAQAAHVPHICTAQSTFMRAGLNPSVLTCQRLPGAGPLTTGPLVAGLNDA